MLQDFNGKREACTELGGILSPVSGVLALIAILWTAGLQIPQLEVSRRDLKLLWNEPKKSAEALRWKGRAETVTRKPDESAKCTLPENYAIILW